MLTSVVIRVVAAAVVGLAAGSVMLDHGVNRLRDTRVTCGEHTMKPGDTCTFPDENGSPTKENYESMKTDQAIEGYVFTIGGTGVLAAGAAVIVVALVRRRRSAGSSGTPDQAPALRG